MKRLTSAMLAVMAASVVTSITLAAQAKPAQPPAKPATSAPAAPAKLVPPIKGEAAIEVTPPATKPVNKENMVVTTIKVRNVSAGAIAGLKVQEYWYSKPPTRELVNANDERLKTPLQPGQTYTFTLSTPFKKEMFQNQYQFSHANGTIKTKPVKKIEG